MKNTSFLSALLLVAGLLYHSIAMAGSSGAGGRFSREDLVKQWRALPSEARAVNLDRVIARYRGAVLREGDLERRNRVVALLKCAEELKADPADGEAMGRFFALYCDAKVENAPSPGVHDEASHEARVTVVNGVTRTSVVISPKDSPCWTGTIHESWFDGYKKSDFEIWAGDNIVGTHFRGWVVFDLSAIPTNAIIKSVTMRAWTSVASNSSAHTLGVCAPLNNCDPRTESGSVLYNNVRTGNVFNAETYAMQSTGSKLISLNASANDDLQKRLGRYNWWALGIFEQGDNDDWGEFYGHDNFCRPTCEVQYELPVRVTIETNPSARTILVDRARYVSPVTVTWEAGSTHSIGTVTPQTGDGGAVYKFSGWSDGGELVHDVTTPRSDTTYTARFATPTGVEEGLGSVPAAYGLEQNYPNPFNPTTAVRYQLPVVSEVKLVVYDVLGREVTVLVNERRNAGVHEVKFDAAGLSSGMYVYRLRAGEYVATKRMTLTK